jgi:UDP-glucuronate decarboxylase
VQKHILIFGGAGFIGTNLIKYLLFDENNKILCIDNLQTGRASNVKEFIGDSNLIWHLGDITNSNMYDGVVKLIEKIFDNYIDEIYNLACPASPPKYMKNPLHTIKTSLSIDWICKLAKKYDAKILHASTSEVYGNPDLLHHPQNEFYNGNVNMIGPRSCYDEGKRIAETIMYEYHKLGVKCKIIRIFNTYGPNMDPNDGRVISNFVCQALLDKDITIYGDGTQTRSFQYVDDLIYGMTEFMNTDATEMGPVNIGNPNEFTMNELAELVLKLIPESKSKIVYKELPKDDPIQRKADISKAFSMFGYKPKVQLEDGLKNTIKYFKVELNSTDFLY